ncbi:MAG: fatty acid desaturase [Crocosphaera sp.]|uniref:fatty acid desaturase n=1 Tax=Crocosphaera sp. TaxID=2729996 RepID=UPI00257EC020|nr:fatty acid desaturase [Crocosphaera sp.]MCH2247992.1 fatty acid desaturase [Crocosphaera sp.]NQZ64580.1 fatty acid desaturase [Crocosphaera sp.]
MVSLTYKPETNPSNRPVISSHNLPTGNNVNQSVRDAIKERVFPDYPWIQEFLTYLTGCPYSEQQPLLYLKPVDYIVGYSLAFVTGISITIVAMSQTLWYPLILLGWLLTTGGTSGMQLGLIHNAAHLKVLRSKKADTWLARILGVIILMPDADTYTKGHRKHHNRKTHQTSEDNTIKTLFGELGFKPGMPVNFYWRKLIKLVNPLFIGKYILTVRFNKCFLNTTSLTSKLFAWAVWTVVVTVITLTHSWMAFAIAYGVPVLIFYTVIHFVRLTVEHKALPVEMMKLRDKRYEALCTDAVFVGELPPSSNLSGFDKIFAWSGWWFRLFFWHGIIRWLIVPADIVVHDYHTRMAGSPREYWEMAIWERQKQQENGCPGWPTLYTSQWGFINAMNTVFNSFSQLPKDYQF